MKNSLEPAVSIFDDAGHCGAIAGAFAFGGARFAPEDSYYIAIDCIHLLLPPNAGAQYAPQAAFLAQGGLQIGYSREISNGVRVVVLRLPGQGGYTADAGSFLTNASTSSTCPGTLTPRHSPRSTLRPSMTNVLRSMPRTCLP